VTWAWRPESGRRQRLAPTAANARPAFGYYRSERESVEWRAFAIQVLALQDDTIASVTNSYYPTTLNVPAITKGTGTVTILNDDIGMPWLKLAAGTSGQMTIYLGNPTAAQDTVTVTSAKPDVAKVPSSFLAQSGRSTLDFAVDAGTPGTSLITVKFPPSLGGTILTANVDVYTPATLAMQPPSLSIPVNTTSTLTVTMSPAPPAPA